MSGIKAGLFLLSLAAVVSLSACQREQPIIWENPPHPEGMAISEQDEYTPLSRDQKFRLKRMRGAGVFVLRQGDYLKIVIPVDEFFLSPKPVLRKTHRSALEAMAAFLKEYQSAYTSPVVRVSGYADNLLGREKRKELSQQYAQVIASYLWNAGVHSKRLEVKGLGNLHPIATGHGPRDAQINRRVVIEING